MDSITPQSIQYCDKCGVYDEFYEEEDNGTQHNYTRKHRCNVILYEYKEKKSKLKKNRDGLSVFCTATSQPFEDEVTSTEPNCTHLKTIISVVPKQVVVFSFTIGNDQSDAFICGVQLAHPQPQFQMTDNEYQFDNDPQLLKKGSSVNDAVVVTFKADDLGKYEMTIMFTFYRKNKKNEKNSKPIIIVREMVVHVDATQNEHKFKKTPYTQKEWTNIPVFKQAINASKSLIFKIPKELKLLFAIDLNEDRLQKMQKFSTEEKAQYMKILVETRTVLDQGITRDNYISFFHYLLWWEETICRINLKKFNMEGVTIERRPDNSYWLEVSGLAEKRPSLLPGDKMYIIPVEDKLTVTFEAVIDKIYSESVRISKIDKSFCAYYKPEATFNVRFMTCRVPMERMHEAVESIFSTDHGDKIFPTRGRQIYTRPITKFYNKLIIDNCEQRSAVEHIVSKSSGSAPYIVFGPPGTGKTMTIVEAIIQIVATDSTALVLVCAESNMAADHIAVNIMKYKRALKMDKLLFRANSINREWSSLPSELHNVSNGTNKDSFYPVKNVFALGYRILVTTLMHSYKYTKCKVTHLFVDEAAQAKEPAVLVPLTRVLAPKGQLVLAGDPKQLGPLCMSKSAGNKGLKISLLERLWLNHKQLYKDSAYITTLVKNFRSDPDILEIPNMLFYPENPLQPQAQPDPLSKVSVLGEPGGERAIVFHAVNSMEQRMGKAPSFFNDKELQMLQRYITVLIQNHHVKADDIGVITPYIRQMYKMKDWLSANNYERIEVGTVESFQGKEKRVILVSTVRANSKLLDYDAKYELGFLVDDKRFNVTITRAKAKLIIIGNPACLVRDKKWRLYMDLCKEYHTYFGFNCEQLKRTKYMLEEISQTRFSKCRLSEVLKDVDQNEEKQK